MMSDSRRSRHSRSRSPYRRDGRSILRSRSRSRSHDSSDVENPGNNLYVTGLSPQLTKKDLEKHFSSEGGTVVDVHLVVDPLTRESRGFGFVTMSTLKEAERCMKYLDRSKLEGRVITVEKARRRRGRTPTPGRYLGYRTIRGRRRSPSYSPYRRSRYGSPRYSSERDRERSYSPYYSRYRDRAYRRHRSRSRSHSYSRSPVGRHYRSYSPADPWPSQQDRSVSPYYRRYNRSTSRSVSPRGRYSKRRSYSPSPSPRPKRSSRRRSYSHSPSSRPRRNSRRRSYLHSPSPRLRSSRRSYSHSVSPGPRKSSRRSYSRGSHARRRSLSSRSRSVSRSITPTPRSASPSLK